MTAVYKNAEVILGTLDGEYVFSSQLYSRTNLCGKLG